VQGFGDVSEKYPTPITPANWAFMVWGIFYPWEAALSVAQFVSPISKSVVLEQVGVWWFLACICQGFWAICFSKTWIYASMGLMVCLLACLSLAASGAREGCWLLEARGMEKTAMLAKWTVSAPLSLHGGWIVAATAVNANAVVSAACLSNSWSLPIVRSATGIMSCLACSATGLLAGSSLAPPDFAVMAALTWALCGVASSSWQSWDHGESGYEEMGVLHLPRLVYLSLFIISIVGAALQILLVVRIIVHSMDRD